MHVDDGVVWLDGQSKATVSKDGLIGWIHDVSGVRDIRNQLVSA